MRICIYLTKKVFGLLTKLANSLRTLYFSSQINSCGKGVKFQKTCYLHGGEYIKIGENTHFQKYLFLTAWDRYDNQIFTPSIEIGNNCDFGAFNHITCTNGITIGDGLLTGKWVTITDNNHGGTSLGDLSIRPQDRSLVSKGKIRIGNNVFIGDKATILAGVEIGDGAVVGANCVVSRNIPAYSVVVGNPMKIICANK